MKILYFCFYFRGKNQRKYSSKKKEKKKKEKSFKNSILSYLSTSYIEIFFHHPTMVGGIIKHSLSDFYHGFLINQVGRLSSKWLCHNSHT